jgi:pyridoxamine 5'-phosphate oxidase
MPSRHHRRDFDKGKLEGTDHSNPLIFLKDCYQRASEKNCHDPHAMVLSTVAPDGHPWSRVVYMRDLVEEGIIFYTNYNSFKSVQIDGNHKVALLFYWDCIETQVRIQGIAEKVPAEVSDAYFAGRPRLSQIGAWASDQSTEIASRELLEERVAMFEKKFPTTVPRPPHWGGFVVSPLRFEFWQGRVGRLHDRICYEQSGNNWRIFRLAP